MQSFLIISSADFGEDVLYQVERAAKLSQGLIHSSIVENKTTIGNIELTLITNYTQSSLNAMGFAALLKFFSTFDAILLDTCASDSYAIECKFFAKALQEYCDLTNGGVVLMAHAAYKLHCIGSDFLNLPMIVADAWGSEHMNLGKVVEPNHPIMKNVRKFDGGSFSGYYSGPLNKQVQSKVIACLTRADTPFVIEVTGLSYHVVMLNFTAVSYKSQESCWTSDSDGHFLMFNALTYCAQGAVFVKRRELFVKNMYQMMHDNVLCNVTFQFV